MDESILARLRAVPGRVGFYYKDLTTGETVAMNEHEPMGAASVIKIPVMIELFRQIEEGRIDPNALITVRDEDRVPICGVLTFFHTGAQLTPIDLCWLMITISDNMATNLLIDLVGIDNVCATMARLGSGECVLRRKLFERDPAFAGLRNTVSAGDIGALLEQMYRGTLLSPQASARMLDMLSGQQCNNKIPLLLKLDMHIAHKTGEDDGITHDCGLVYAKRPFILCFCTNDVEDAGRMNVLMAEIAAQLCEEHGGPADED